MKTRTILLVSLIFLPNTNITAQPNNLLQPNQRIVVLGDSNTYAGHYIVFLETALRQRYPDRRFELINVGLPSETASGLSEPDHPFPRPTVHERLDRVLAKMKPDLVLACYGMNDGIYYPHSDKRFQAYKDGINKLIAKVEKAGAKIVLLTPPPFDPVPLKKRGKPRAAGAKKYAWFAPFADYDRDVLRRYAAWIMQQKKRVALVIDIRTPIVEHLAQQRRSKPDYTLAGDGVHPNKMGHRLMAEAILQALQINPGKKANPRLLALVQKRQFLLRDAWLTHTGHKRPGVRKGMPLAQARREAASLEAKIRRLAGIRN